MTPTILEQTGWTGLMSVTICQDNDVLRRVTRYDYSCSDEGFMEYCDERGIMGRMTDFEFCCDYTLTKDEYMRREHPIEPPEPGERPSTHVFSGEELEAFWAIVVAARGAFQDCWEMYTFRR